jgi:hypothetical protein
LELSLSISSLNILLIGVLLIFLGYRFERLGWFGLNLFFFLSHFLHIIFFDIILLQGYRNLMCLVTSFACLTNFNHDNIFLIYLLLLLLLLLLLPFLSSY